MPYVTSEERLAEERGRELGREDAVAEGARSFILRLLRHVCGELPPLVQQRLNSMCFADLEELAVALPHFKGLDDLMNWFDQPSTT